jgi:hypothetical protein
MAVVQPAAALPPTNLPAPVSELIGRDAEVAEVVSLVGAHRLVSLTGPGGIGKTRHPGALVIKRGDLVTGLRLLRAGLDELGEARTSFWFFTLLGQLSEALGRAGQIADGFAAIHGAIERCERTEERWALAELLRIRGELLLLEDAPAAAAADHFGKPSTGHAGKAPSPGNYAPPRALPGCCATMAVPPMPRRSSSRSISIYRRLRHGRPQGRKSPSRRPNRERRPAGKLD